MRVVEASEIVAADVFGAFEKDRRRVTLCDVERHLAQLGAHGPDCGCGRCPPDPRVTAQRVHTIASGWQRRVRGTRLRALR